MTPEVAGGQSLVYQLALFVASMCFLVGLRLLTNAETARRGQQLAVIGMFVAVVGTLLNNHIVSYQWIIVGLVVGTAVGIPMGLKIPMTKMPERIALSHSFGGLAVALVGVSEYHVSQQLHGPLGTFALAAVGFEVVVGSITFTGSLVAFAKLQGLMTGKPIVFPFQNILNLVLLIGTVSALGLVLVQPERQEVFFGLVAAGVVLGVIGVIRIGGADMPVVICLLNSYAGLAASASGFALDNNVLIICGALDGGSGLILAMIMSRAMNRSFSNVMFGAFGSDAPAAAAGPGGGTVHEGTVEDAAELLKLAQSVIVVPGYGMAVAQAQHAVRDLANVLQAEGAVVRYAIHPVAGRMPGHMNVLLAEADVPYDQLFELDAINDDFQRTDVVLVVGANDVVNPAAKTTPDSPIYGMPVLNADQAKAVIVLKRSMNPGFSGIENELFILPKTMMVFGDAKPVLGRIVGALRGSH